MRPRRPLDPRRQRLKLLALIAIFALPLMTAWAMVEWRIGIPEQRTAHGELVPDIPPLAQWPLTDRDSEADADTWLLAFDCSLDCAALADQWWRLHRALGREAPRLARLRIGGAGEALPGERLARWQGQAPAWQTPGRVWLLAPGGEALLTYSSEVEARDVLDDINHLLRVNPESRSQRERQVSQR
ncbi:hypothetical protein HOP52_04500 [Halomonas campisalis]|uniref:Transmembrane protein n=2 Tax=Billgrantia campisalis TaxID=74661 RepID=A0ABS9P5I0_9GAMM|nr:hypothetical protein [Halomonas campisalis]MCG6657036.1 hypothetical protein [Halomonas campisalis]MDR5862221.1 hypothetical protein [Halomonas campisalis]